MTNWKPEVKIGDAWHHNSRVFATKAEAEESAHYWFGRWAACSAYRAVESADPVNYARDSRRGIDKQLESK